jgi:UDP-N-acetylglucosamine/UDP-N-acetylgalactosamine diphosphorylase
VKQELLRHLEPYGQAHLLAHWDSLSANEQGELADQIRTVDFSLMAKLHQSGGSHDDWATLARRAEPPPAYRLNGEGRTCSLDDVRQRGEAALSSGKLAVILVAGGQGSRLGFDHPKGMFPIGPISGATLFQVLFEKLLARSRRHGVRIPIYLMTSPATHEETVQFLKQHDYFGVPAEDVCIFCQGTMPAVDLRTGKLLLEEKHKLFKNPDGHGGMLAALARSGGLADARRRGVEQFFYCQIDNPLVSICDPEFIGYHLLAGAEISTQVVAKRGLRDKVGNVVVIDGRMQVIEYSDLNPLPDEIVGRKSADGSPVFWAGSIAVHIFDRAFLERMADSAEGLPFHTAKKAVPHLDASGRLVDPTEPNAIKFERFIFDLLPAARHGIVVEVDEARAFAPLKNASTEPSDTKETVQAARMALERSWLRAAGIQIADDVPIEISPLLAQDAADVARRRGELPGSVTAPAYLRHHGGQASPLNGASDS